jgi:hypothetical protein
MLSYHRLAVLVCLLLVPRLALVLRALVPVEVLTLVLRRDLVDLAACELGVRTPVSATVKPRRRGLRASLSELVCSGGATRMCRQAAYLFLSHHAALAMHLCCFWLSTQYLGLTAIGSSDN